MNLSLIDTLRSGHRVWSGSEWVAFDANRHAGGLLAIAVPVVADEVSAFYWYHERQIWGPEDFGPVRPPFDALWLEWTIPKNPVIDLLPRIPPGRKCGALVCLTRDDGGQFIIQTFTEGAGATEGIVALPPVHFNLNDDGASDLIPMVGATEGAHLAAMMGVDINKALSEIAALCHVPLLALSFMHCRNITIEDVPGPPPKVARKRAARLGFGETKMTRIRLPGAARTARTPTEVRNAVGQAPLHMVRGHFKTYTEDAPLFGKRTGTYWWGWQARGNQANGVHVPTYEVGPSDGRP